MDIDLTLSLLIGVSIGFGILATIFWFKLWNIENHLRNFREGSDQDMLYINERLEKLEHGNPGSKGNE